MNLAKKIFKQNEKKNINMSRLARLLNVSKASISLNMAGKRNWSADALIKAMLATGKAYIDPKGKYIVLETDFGEEDINDLLKYSNEKCLHSEEEVS